MNLLNLVIKWSVSYPVTASRCMTLVQQRKTTIYIISRIRTHTTKTFCPSIDQPNKIQHEKIAGLYIFMLYEKQYASSQGRKKAQRITFVPDLKRAAYRSARRYNFNVQKYEKKYHFCLSTQYQLRRYDVMYYVIFVFY